MKAFGIEQEGRATAAQKPGEWLAGVGTGLETFMKERGTRRPPKQQHGMRRLQLRVFRHHRQTRVQVLLALAKRPGHIS